MKKTLKIALSCALGAVLFVGCTKDYTPEINNLSNRVQTLESQNLADKVSALESTVNNLGTSISTLDAQIKATDAKIAECAKTSDLVALYATKAELEAAKAEMTKAWTLADATISSKFDNYYTKSDVESLLDSKIGTSVATLETKLIEYVGAQKDAVVKDLTTLINNTASANYDRITKEQSDALKAAVETLNKTIDANKDAAAKDLANAVTTLNKTIDANKDAAAKDLAAAVEALNKAINSNKDAAAKDLENAVALLNKTIDTNKDAIEGALKTAQENLSAKIDANDKAQTKALEDAVAKLEASIKGFATEKQLLDSVATLKGMIEDCTELIAAKEADLLAKIADAKTYTDEVKDALTLVINTNKEDAAKSLSDAVKKINETIDANKTAFDEYAAKNDKAIADIAEEIKTLATKEELADAKKALEEAFDKADAAIKSDLQAVKDDLKTLSDNFTELKKAYDETVPTLATKEQVSADIATAVDAAKNELDKAINTVAADLAAANERMNSFFGDKTNEELKAWATDIQKAVSEVANALAIQDRVAALEKKMSNILTSIVFVPELYFEGIEAMKYDYLVATKWSKTVAAEATTDNTGADAKWTEKSYAPSTKKADSLSVASEGTANYFVCPENFDVTKATWALEGLDREVITRAGAPAWTPQFVSISTPDKNGESTVKFTIKNADKLTSATKGAPVSVVSLNATLDGKNVNSDFAAIVPFKEGLKALGFSKTYQGYEACRADSKKFHLYPTIKDAVEAEASVEVPYNKGAFSLNFIDIHALGKGTTLHEVGTDEVVYTLAQFQDKYPGSTMEFAVVPYFLGKNETAESEFCEIKGTDFIPKYATQSGSVICPVDSEAGISAVGRKPIICVTLKDAAKNVILAGYFKIEIVKEAAPDVPDELKAFDLKDFGTIPYLCDLAEFNTKWIDMSYDILEKELGIEYDMFHEKYTWETGKTYVVKSGKDGKKLADYEDGSKYGTVVFTKDTGAGAINDKFTVTVDKTQADKIGLGKSKVLYAHFTYNGGDVFIGFKVTVDKDGAKVTFGTPNPAYWFNDVESAKDNTVRINVKVPNKWMDGAGDNDNVTIYVKDLNDNYIGNTVKVTLTTESAKTYGKYLKDTDFKYTFKFSKTQPTIGGYIFVTNKELTEIYAKTSKTAKDSTLIITLDPEITYDANNLPVCNITYECNDVSKKLLNLYDHKSTVLKEMLYCNITLSATYGQCEIPCGSEEFHARFLRPVTIGNNAEAELKDGVPTGDRIEIGKIFQAVDWQGYKIFKSAGDTAYVPCYYPDEDNAETAKVNWYGYYGFSKVKVDIDNIQTDQTGKVELLKTVNPAAEIWVSQIDDVMTKIEPAEVDITDINSLKGYVFNYFNNMGVVKDFYLYIPFQIEYAWGTVTETVKVLVKKTY